MSNDLLLIDPEVQNEMSLAISNTTMELDETLRSMDSREQAIYLRDNIRNLLPIFAKISQAALYLLWKVYSDSLWCIPLENGEHYGSFRDWVDNEIGPTFHKRNSTAELAVPMMQDAVRVVERVLPYAMKNPVKDAKGTPITPRYLIENVGFGKLKITSSRFLDNERTPERDKLVYDLTHMSAREIRKEYTQPRIPTINYALNINSSGSSDILMCGLSPTQVALIRTTLGRMISEHAVHINAANRDALLSLLEDSAINHYDIEGD